MHLHLVGGARPNFMKIAPLWHALRGHQNIRPVFVHTGQHRDISMTDDIWRDLGLPLPNYVLSVHPTNTHGDIQDAYRALCQHSRPDMTLVVGDVTSSLAAASAAKELNIPLIHLEAGLRCFDPDMVEERNRIAIDGMADLLFAPSQDAVDNLLAEGTSPDRIRLVGNIMIDSLVMTKPLMNATTFLESLQLETQACFLVTLHRRENVDDEDRLRKLCDVLVELAQDRQVCFPVHPRTRLRLNDTGLMTKLHDGRVMVLPPLAYADFMGLMAGAAGVITDSGGVQEETTFLNVPCFTLRNSTERPVTITHGTNMLVQIDQLVAQVQKTTEMPRARVRPAVPYWDGNTASRVVQAIEEMCVERKI
ncbi:non-hydrolyzing UDP-N-acetylglucosamine 2-epimerase [Thalassospira lucentensis]|uniref:UDP-N-acetylglucosamine 2-epimerase (Non-hydrolyzing) n=1 Tax=Thalassospira lucentensis TaxID=168935 RepID=A0A358HN33_9PROT|nr:UDP-N-acetylglucosamine 2-epimerase (non-hydrolyzing) [Thalassospira lucentensis]HBU96567.1 UDP-N-acetylglucosamine 2-epimerase (non-hydrolyzing) [Thalassospira lucentensis]HCW65891.1 UDP-N-acetylglucosamine 2-epimerase (non-hydrolyzing) [Thalassospira lucentensis]|tara:strand:- start:433 stop:1524 length:1092 start_codon:yes stop_codon:yes gene_type:complete